MTFSKTSALALAFALANALPQTPAGLAIPPSAKNLPNCAVTPLITLLTATGCSQVTTKCLCQDPARTLASIQGSIRTSCTDDAEYEQVWSYVQGCCPTNSSTASTTEAPTSSSSASSSTVVAQGNLTATSTTNGTAIVFSAPIITASNTTSNGTTITTPPTVSATGGSEDTIVPSDGGASSYGTSFAALTVAIGCMTWVFAEL
ncbi:hypothetical protein DOTSEDRAFT_81849 [Dothistroma septosporum NZE10]|uniref:CFEM domain-containing protein n=1 Tax=Dothistroma septosporum (strain NZE10 / CBS 128990) TaxID=675120 RepID=N1PGS4_DOTSN|nr:hypothetical protein DOTSEDRAFT_81849 [Dothistroma septosporum NZE10]